MGGIDFNSIQDFLQTGVFVLAIIVIGIILLFRKASQGDVKGSAMVAVATVIGGILVFGGSDLFRSLADGFTSMISG